MRRARDWIALGMLAFAGLAMASTPGGHRQVEASMVLTGTIDIGPDGAVAGYGIDRADEVPDYVLAYLGEQVRGWRFEPVEVEGRAVPARSAMSIRMRATQDGDNVLVSVHSANFYNPDERRMRVYGVGAGRERMVPPRYPAQMLRAGATANVFVVVRVGPDGEVEDAAVEQVNLFAIGSASRMASMRRAFANASLQAARSWVFAPVRSDDPSGARRDIRRVPVEFNISDGREPGYGEWSGYVAGPRHRPDWVDEQDAGNDALAAGGVYSVGGGLKLLTALGPGEG